MAEKLSLNPDTVEKDYVLGWILAGIHRYPAFAADWIFKGGTSLKKCFFETYRFSEDLDFTVLKSEQMNSEFLTTTFQSIADAIYEDVGIIFFKENIRFKIVAKNNGRFSAQGHIHYNGPLMRKQGMISIKIDLTTDEILVQSAEQRRIQHPYSDQPKEGLHANCYSFEEVVAEKIRALGQRARPRDLYDVIHLFRNRALLKNPDTIHGILVQKCKYKNIPVPTFESVENHEKIGELESQWENMLAHQLPSLPPLESFWLDLEPFFDWLNKKLEEDQLVQAGEGVVFQAGPVYNLFSLNSNLQRIQFAAANRLCIQLSYNDQQRLVEPLSFRTARNGNKLFFGFERNSSQLKSFSVNKIQAVQLTRDPYEEKYLVEISGSGAISMPPLRRNRRIWKRRRR